MGVYMFEKNEINGFLEGLNDTYTKAFEQWAVSMQEVGTFWSDLYKKYFEVVMHCPFEGTVLFGLAKEWKLKPFGGCAASEIFKDKKPEVKSVIEKPALVVNKEVVAVKKPVVAVKKQPVEMKVVEDKKPESVLSALVKAVKEKPVVAKKPEVKKPVVKKVAPKKPAPKKVVADVVTPLIEQTEKKVAPKRAQVKPVVKVESPKVEEIKKVEAVEPPSVEINKTAE